MDSDDGEVEDARIENDDMEFCNEPETGGASSSAAGIDSQDTMVGMLTSMNIVDISEVFSPPRVVMQGLKIGLKAGSSMDLLTGWDFNLESNRN